MDANKQREQEQIKTFISVTGSSEAIARQYLEASIWDINAATTNYYASDNAKSNYDPPPPSVAPKASPTPSRTGPRIATLGSMNDEESPENRYYTGGKSSGIQVQGRPEDKPGNIVDKIFQKKSDPIPEPTAPVKSYGSGFKLGASPAAPVIPVVDTRAEQEEDRIIVITFWRQGFVVDDGPLRKYDEPSNESFLKDIDEGVVPNELRAKMSRTARAANVSLVDKKSQDYEEPYVPKPTVISFSGTAQKLGDVSTIPKVKTTVKPSYTSTGGEAKIQIRLGNGSTLRATFRMDQTIRDIREYIDREKPQPKTYSLLTPFPRAVLSNLDQTIGEADLNNSSIIQKYN